MKSYPGKNKKNTSKWLVIIILSALFTNCTKNEKNYDAAGTFETKEIIVSAESSGKILEFGIEEGEKVTQNQLVGKIDSVQLYLKKQQLYANIKAIQYRRPNVKKQIAAIEQQISTAKTERKRVENLLKENAATQKQMDDANAQIAVLEKQLEAQKTTLETANDGISSETESLNLQIKQLEDQLNKCKIISPISGVVLIKYSEAGEITTQGKPLYKIADTENMILRAYVTGDQLTKLKIGQNVKVFADFGKDQKREYTGVLNWISSKSEFTPKTIQTRDERANLVYAVKILVKNDNYLKIGMYGNIIF